MDEGALKELFKNGHWAGAALVVFTQEPPVDLKLLKLPALIATGHIGGSTEEAVLAMGWAATAELDSPRLVGSYSETV